MKNYSSCISKNNENLCNNNGDVQEKKRHGEIQETINFDPKPPIEC